MIEQQRTIKEPVSFSGVGLHTGNISTITFHPAEENYGFKFVRTDVPNSPEIPALVDNVVDISRGTTLAVDGTQVHTVEHVLAALVGLQIDNCRMELTANEPPVGDGSAMPFVQVLKQTEIVNQKAPRDYLVFDQPVRYTNEAKGVDIVALPMDDFRITVMVDYNNPALGSQHTGMFDLEKEFISEFASSRTFCFLNEVEMLWDQGLIRGGNLDNAIVIVDREMSDDELHALLHKLGIQGNAVLGSNGILNNNSLRYKNEPARHKLLDMLGDLALVGAPMKAQILAARPGHASNIEFARKIRKMYEQKKVMRKIQPKKIDGAVMDINAILKVMPHRYPFLLVDRITEFDTEQNRIIGYKNVTINEPFFPGHFPERPVMPGVLILEAMAQCGCMLLLNVDGNFTDNKLVFFMGINNAKFRKPVIPGDQLVMDIKMTGKRFNTISLQAKAYVDGKLVAEADLQAAVVDKEA
ncbi:MAG: bifunctional UDP-3-O-[3-hydroxymyristoyl] N-acetylglucosamine deacetylase/3-hydroxyacyl-ACP dehydratase [Candidatus Kapabacteria bacterium]|nr:bifunctional UDP-3-O-[3-hydroxymyristoyl] N-acetylglucosamine deacetylase/3-hydroxyacyl-ACP dehydratase [Candidatus Kapabacteria bacterium]MBX7154516.1 bifunctional UDP-3-O-[3-hydroxymyristoyl] N-acetylglucosamine deacetylase/3-hydroxyacyl-ACP dehydratase [Bacteroidota bacterium]